MISVAGAKLARTCLDAGLLDEIIVNLVPLLLGKAFPSRPELGRRSGMGTRRSPCARSGPPAPPHERLTWATLAGPE
jgi:dihydrofolate reductase